MKGLSKIFLVALSLFICFIAGKIYLTESEKVAAYEKHMSSLANLEDIEYISYDDQVKMEKADAAAAKEAKKAQEKAEREEQERIAKEQEQAKKEADKKAKEEAELAEKKQKEEQENTVRLDAPIINQLPKYKYGCESVSLTMMLRYAGVDVTEDEVISKVPMDTTPIEIKGGLITKWGNPEVGFVGDITGAGSGYSIDPVALAPVVNEFLPGKTLDLTGCDTYKLADILKSGRTMVVWVNKTFEEPAVSYTWTTSDGISVNAYRGQHAVLLTGMDLNNYYYNDPYTGEKDVPVSRAAFENVWVKMGRKALSYYK